MRYLVANTDLSAVPAAGGHVLHRYRAYALVEYTGPGPLAATGEALGSEVVVHGRPLTVPEGACPAAGSGPRVVTRLIGPPATTWVTQLRRRGFVPAFWCPPHGVCLTLPRRGAAVDELAALPWVAGVVRYEADHCARSLTPVPGHPEQGFADVVCFSRTDRARVVRVARELGLRVLDSSRTKLRVALPPGGDDGAALAALRDLVGVKIADRARPATLLTPSVPLATAPDLDHLAAALGMVDAAGAWQAGQDGLGEVVAVTDTGLDTGDPATVHPDLGGRVALLRSWPINPSWSSVVTNPGGDDGAADLDSGHGTYVAGLAVGDGTASGGRRRGVAPAARLVFQAIEQYAGIDAAHAGLGAPGYYLAGRPLDLRDLLAAGAAAGARVHVMAWGDAARGGYPDTSFEVDLYLHEHPEALVVVAAGNSGSDVDGDREVDAGSLDAPATAKNVLTVGATEGPVYGVGYRGTWTGLQADGRTYANPADRNDAVSGDPAVMALLSSAGPTVDGRTKPDLCAPGTNLAGPRSSRISSRGWGLATPAPSYMYLGGTSVAVAVAGGFAAVLRQQWRAARSSPGGRRRALSGAALKAVAIAGAAAVTNRAGTGPELRRVSGYGRVWMATSLPQGVDHEVLVLNDGGRGLVTGTRRTWRLSLTRPGPLRVVLTWYDAPGERLVNDLDLRVDGPAGLLAWGNHDPGSTGSPDRTNTVEVVDLPQAGAADLTITVTGVSIPAGPQRFALVARAPRGSTSARHPA